MLTKEQNFQDRMEAMLLVSRISLDVWFAAGMKKFVGQEKMKRVIEYLIKTVGE